MRKLMLVGAILAVVLVAAAPALAQVSQEFSEARNKSGAATPKIEDKNTGNNANLCPTVQQVVNTGNVLNEQGVVQYFSKVDDITFNADTPTQITITPSETATCDQTLSQAAAAG